MGLAFRLGSWGAARPVHGRRELLGVYLAGKRDVRRIEEVRCLPPDAGSQLCVQQYVARDGIDRWLRDPEAQPTAHVERWDVPLPDRENGVRISIYGQRRHSE